MTTLSMMTTKFDIELGQEWQVHQYSQYKPSTTGSFLLAGMGRWLNDKKEIIYDDDDDDDNGYDSDYDSYMLYLWWIRIK